MLRHLGMLSCQCGCRQLVWHPCEEFFRCYKCDAAIKPPFVGEE
jgi:hypothetical protein